MIGKGRAGACSFPESFLPRDPRQRLSKGARARRGGRRPEGAGHRAPMRSGRRAPIRGGRAAAGDSRRIKGHVARSASGAGASRGGRGQRAQRGARGSRRHAHSSGPTRRPREVASGARPAARGMRGAVEEEEEEEEEEEVRWSRGWREEHAVGCAGLKGQGPQAGRALRARSSATVDSAAPTATRGSVGQKAAMMSRSSARASSLLTEGSSGGALQVTDTFRSRNTAGNSLCLALKRW
ncbi:unnamed protein product [Prorocentrum cordatum]|uniref:Uncharacterized protein n=1 Tax=Prorocentrum cordatum TaxID=2364126 RepID=A0ABN9TSX5_9DINO|nr:unnamed protein product [Polarella glacialis]